MSPGEEAQEELEQVGDPENIEQEKVVDSDKEELSAEWDSMTEGDKEENSSAESTRESSRVLDQNEIDSLLGFDEEGGEKEKSGIQAILASSLVSYERLPMLEVVFDRFVRLMSGSLRNFTGDTVEVAIDTINSVRYGDYLNSVPLPAMISVFKAEEWDNYGLLIVDTSLIYSTVDVLLGGKRGKAAMRIEGRPYTTIERSLVERMVHVMLSDLSAAFDPICSVSFRFERLEINPRFATISRATNAAIVSRMQIDMEGRGGKVELLLPYATLEPVRERLLQQFMGEKFGRDSIWESHLAEELWLTKVDVEAEVDNQIMRLNDVFEMQVGSRIMLNASPDSQVLLNCGGVPLFRGRMGRKGDRIAIKIDSSLLGQKKPNEL